MVGAIFILFWMGLGNGDILFPSQDPFLFEKKKALHDLQELIPVNSAIEAVLKTEKVIFWANSVQPPPSSSVNTNSQIFVPSFIAATALNESFLRAQIEKNCECSLLGQQVAGILVAHPYEAAVMYFKEGWMGHGPNVVDGVVPPIVIIYHELAHASDYLRSSDQFFDLASLWDKRWKNGAEHSAVAQQNELVLALATQKKLNFSLRRSYGKNKLFRVNGLYSVQEISPQSVSAQP